MDAKPFLKRTILIALVSALPAFVGTASAHGGGGHGGGGFSAGGSSGGHGSSGHSGNGSNSGQSSSSSSTGHSSNGPANGHSSSVSKGGHSTGDPSAGPATAVSGRGISGSFAHSNTVRGRHEPHAQFRHFDTGWGHGDWQEGEEYVDWQRYNRRRLFGFIWY
jgi:hypothetical protein